MINISLYKGISQFNLAYKIMLENDTHALGSIDRVLIKNMIKLCSETADYLYSSYTPTISRYKKGSRPVLEQHLEKVSSSHNSDEELVEIIAQFTSSLKERAEVDINLMLVGGTEEEIIERGSDWCTDVARVGCALFQIISLPSRMVYLADTGKAYHGHTIIETLRSGIWGAVDCVTDVIYRHPNGEPASTWDLMNNLHLVKAHYKGNSTYYTNPGQFRSAAICNYFIWQQAFGLLARVTLNITSSLNKMTDCSISIKRSADSQI